MTKILKNKNFLQDFKKIDKERSRFICYAKISISTLIIGAILPTPILSLFIFYDKHYDPYVNALSQIIVGTSASILAASLIEIFSALRNIWIREADEDFFRFFFGPKSEQGHVAVVIPRFDPNTIPEETFMKFPDALKSMFKRDSTFLASSDTKALTNIEILFEQHHSKRPEVRFADEKLDDLSKYETVFFVGLFSNAYLLDKLNNNKLFFLEKETHMQAGDSTLPGLRLAYIDGDELQQHPRSNKAKFCNESNNEYGLIAKVSHDDIKIFVIGGINASLTVKCSEFLLNNWQSIYSLVDDSRNEIKVEYHDFAICMKSCNSKKLTYAYKFVEARSFEPAENRTIS
jgi:hypothetical protein